MDESWVRAEIVNSLNEWGVSGSRKDQTAFRAKVLREGVAMIQDKEKEPVAFDQLKLTKFPTDATEAITLAVKSDFEDDHRHLHWVTCDELGDEAPFPPFYKRERRHAYGSVVTYPKRNQYSKFSNEDLDPFRRFTFRQIGKSEYWFDRWVLSPDAALLGTVFEAMLACHALQFEPCFNCKHRKSLRWSGGSKTSFQDLVCIKCKSLFEVKTKENMEKVERTFQCNNLSGGSFSRYSATRNGLLPGQKMFIVMLPRTFTVTQAGLKVYPVFAAEIEEVAPSLTCSSFNPHRKDYFHFKSSVRMKLQTKKKWFDLPKPSTSIDNYKIYDKAFIACFSREEFDCRRAEVVSDSVASQNREEKRNQGSERKLEEDTLNEPVVSKVNALKEDLESLRVGNEEEDDWESMY